MVDGLVVDLVGHLVGNSVEWKAGRKADGMDVLKVGPSAAKSVPLVAVSLELLMVVWKVD